MARYLPHQTHGFHEEEGHYLYVVRLLSKQCTEKVSMLNHDVRDFGY